MKLNIYLSTLGLSLSVLFGSVDTLHYDLTIFGIKCGEISYLYPQNNQLFITTYSTGIVDYIFPFKNDYNTTFDTSFYGVKHYNKIIKNFPEIPIICAHWGGGLPFYALMPEVLESLKSVYFDTSASPFLYSNRIYPVVASLVGIGGILMGSDYPLLSARRVLKDIEDSMVLNEDQKTAITGGNAVKLLGINVEGK